MFPKKQAENLIFIFLFNRPLKSFKAICALAVNTVLILEAFQNKIFSPFHHGFQNRVYLMSKNEVLRSKYG